MSVTLVCKAWDQEYKHWVFSGFGMFVRTTSGASYSRNSNPEMLQNPKVLAYLLRKSSEFAYWDWDTPSVINEPDMCFLHFTC